MLDIVIVDVLPAEAARCHEYGQGGRKRGRGNLKIFHLPKPKRRKDAGAKIDKCFSPDYVDFKYAAIFGLDRLRLLCHDQIVLSCRSEVKT